MPEKLHIQLTEEQIQYLAAFIEKQMAREEEDRISRDRLIRIREAVLEKIASGSVWAVLSLVAVRLFKKYFD